MNRHWARSARHWLVEASLLAAGCGEHLQPLPPVSWEGENLRFGTDVEERPVWGGTLAYLDRTAGAVRKILGGENEPLIEYFWLGGDLGSYDPPCPEDVFGCGRPGLVRASFVPGEHEIVHAAKPFMLPQFFEEGLAVYLGGWPPGGIPESTDVLAAIRGGGDPLSWEEYWRAGHFVSYLWMTYGLDPLRSLSDAGLGYGAGREEVEQAFAEVFGEPLADVVARDQAEYPVCDSHGYRRPVAACEAAAPVVVEDGVAIGADLRCDGSQAVRQDVSNEVAVELPLYVTEERAGSTFVVEVLPETATGIEVELIPCDGGCLSTPIPDGALGPLVVPPTPIPAGRYALSIRAPMGTAAQVEISF